MIFKIWKPIERLLICLEESKAWYTSFIKKTRVTFWECCAFQSLLTWILFHLRERIQTLNSFLPLFKISHPTLRTFILQIFPPSVISFNLQSPTRHLINDLIRLIGRNEINHWFSIRIDLFPLGEGGETRLGCYIRIQNYAMTAWN